MIILSNLRFPLPIRVDDSYIYDNDIYVTAINPVEQQGVYSIRRLLESRVTVYLPESLQNMARGFLEQRIIEIITPEILDKVSPPADNHDPYIPDEIKKSNLIIIGSDYFNMYSRIYSKLIPYKFVNRDRQFANEPSVDLHITKPGLIKLNQQRTYHGVINRFKKDNKVIIICAGTCGRATKAASEWLVKNWKDMLKRDVSTVYIGVSKDK